MLVGLCAAENEITLCDLVLYRAFAGKSVSIRGRIGFTMHGVAFLPSSCKNSPPGVAVLTPGNANTPSVDYILENRDLQLLAPFLRPSGGAAVACGVLSGRIFYKKDFELQQSGGGPEGNGYGPRGALRWALVLSSVKEIRACD